MPRAITKCPSCRSPVTNYTLSCPVCGYDVDGARQAAASRRSLPLAPSLPRLGDDGLRIGIALLLALAMPLFGLILATYFAWEAHNDGRAMTRNVMIFLIGLAAVPLVFGYSLWGGLLARL